MQLATLLLAARFMFPVPDASQVEIRKDLLYMKAGGKDILLDLYRPAKIAPGTRLPVAIFMNAIGGSQRPWEIYVGWAKAATANGFAAINADPDVESGEAAFDALLAYVAAHADEFHFDANRIVVYAASANVSNALPWVENPKRTAVKAAAMYYGAAEVPVFRLDLPLLFVRAGLDRPGMNQALAAVSAKAIQANAPVTLLNHAGGHHGFEQLDDNDATRETIAATFRFFHSALDPAYQAGIRASITEADAAGAVASSDFARAVPLYASLVNPQTASVPLLLSYGEALIGAGQYKPARAIFERVKAIGTAGYRDLGIPAARAAALDGDGDAAVAWLKSIPTRFLPTALENDPVFAGLHSRDDFHALFKKD